MEYNFLNTTFLVLIIAEIQEESTVQNTKTIYKDTKKIKAEKMFAFPLGFEPTCHILYTTALYKIFCFLGIFLFLKYEKSR